MPLPTQMDGNHMTSIRIASIRIAIVAALAVGAMLAGGEAAHHSTAAPAIHVVAGGTMTPAGGIGCCKD
jgi:hypothetical protein